MGGYGSGRPATRPQVERLMALDLAAAREIGYPITLRPSNLGRGVVPYLACQGCRGLARVLYLAAPRYWCCRRCVRPVYRSSRQSDARVSAVLREPETAARYAVGKGLDCSPAALRLALRLADAGIFVLLKLVDRVYSTHAAAGRPWSAARRAAQEARGQ